ARHARVYLVGVCDDPDKRALWFDGGGGEDERLFFTLLQPMQESQELLRKGIGSVVFGPELTADRFAKRAMPGGPFCKLDRRQGHASSPSARSPSRYQRRPHAVGSGLLASTKFGFATILGGTRLRPTSTAPYWRARAGKWRIDRSLTTPRTGATAPKRRAPARIK